MLDDMQREDVVAVIDQMVEDLLDAARIAAPPVDAIALASGGARGLCHRGHGSPDSIPDRLVACGSNRARR